MGVINRFIIPSDDDPDTYATTDHDNINQSIIDVYGDIVEPTDEELAIELQDQELTRSLRRRSRRSQRIQRSTGVLKAEPSFQCLGIRGKGYKKCRRYENANLMTGHDVENAPITIHDFIPESESAFAQFLASRDAMKAWDEFIEWSEQQMMARHDRAKTKNADSLDGQKTLKSKRKNSRDGCAETDRRASHPAYSGKECFERIDGRIKQMLRKKRIPLGLLESTENEMVDFFKKDPASIYRSCLESSYHRLVLHACCQYHDLRCKSYDECGARWSQVDNPNEQFILPNINLASYVERSLRS